MLFRPAITALFLFAAGTALAQQPAPALNFKKTSSGIQYAFVVDKPTSLKPKEGDLIRIHMASVAGNRYLYNSWMQNKGKPAEFNVSKPSFKGDIIEAITMMSVGDSLVALVDADQVYRNTKQKKPDFIKKGDKIQYMIRLVNIKSKEQLQKEQQAALNKQLKEQMEKQQKEEAKQAGIQEKALQQYFTKNAITPNKTASGLYYVITREGGGARPVKNDTVALNYTGRLIDGTVFDSNTDTLFKHVQPFEFPLGNNRVIRGWDEGIELLPLGSKATFYIPSRLAYGAQSMPGNPSNPKGIPANSILIFDVELNSIKPQNKQ